MADAAALAGLSKAVAALVATQGQAGQKIKSYGLAGVTPAALPPAASPSALDGLLAQASWSAALAAQAGSIIKSHAPVIPVVGATGKLTINYIFDTTSDVKWADNPNRVAAEAVLANVKAAIERCIVVPFDLTVNINVGYTRCAGIPMTGALGQSMYYVTGVAQADIQAAFAKLPLNALQRVAFSPANLAAFWPLLNGQQLECTFANAAAIGAAGWDDASARAYLKTALTGWVGFGNFNWDFSPDGSTNTTGGFSFFGTVFHEITEVLGRVCGGFFGDLCTWAAAGIRNIQMGVGRRYISSDGAVVIADCNQQAGGDYGDLAGDSDSFLAWTGPGLIPSRSPTLPGSAANWKIMSLLGYLLSLDGLAVGGVAA